MAAKGWMSVRNLAGTDKFTIKQFFDIVDTNYVVCPDCEGSGEISDYDDTVFDGVSSIKVSENKVLSELQSNGNLNTDKLNSIIKKLIHSETQCNRCEGLGLIHKKSRKKKNEPIKL